MEVRFKATYAGVSDVYEAGKVYDIDKAFAERLLNAGEAELVEKKKETNTATKKV
jgi:hypothetical protein